MYPGLFRINRFDDNPGQILSHDITAQLIDTPICIRNRAAGTGTRRDCQRSRTAILDIKIAVAYRITIERLRDIAAIGGHCIRIVLCLPQAGINARCPTAFIRTIHIVQTRATRTGINL